ncbi:MAG: U32 family peptidase [Bacilli bacterium]|nr:U32 family peptidase [Bacilli bacterium]
MISNNILIYVDDTKHIDDYRKVGVSAFLFALDGYSVGYNTYSLDDIINVEVSNKYVIINRMLDCEAVDGLRNIIKNFKGIKGIVYEDIAVYQVVKEMGLDFEMIFYQNHFGTNVNSINFWLDRVESMFVSNEITYDEIDNIVNNATKKVCVNLYGYNQVMYSRRLLLSNWSEEFNVPYKNTNVLEDKATHVKFRAVENEYGTVMYSDKIFNGKDLCNLNNVKFFYVNTMMIEHSLVMDFLSDINNHMSLQEDDGFLNRETIYKLKERKK